jgi:hypothetical protein
MVDCGVISKETGQWEGVPTSDAQFIGITIALGVANSAEILVPDTSAYPSIDMTGFSDILIAIKPSNGGNYTITAAMGPDTEPFGGLKPVNAAVTLKGNVRSIGSEADFEVLVSDTESLTADVWNIFMIQERLADQANLQFKIQNASGGSSDISFAFMRVV